VLGNERRRSRFLFAKFRMLVNIAPPGDQLLLDLGGALADFLLQLRDGLRAPVRRSPARSPREREQFG